MPTVYCMYRTATADSAPCPSPRLSLLISLSDLLKFTSAVPMALALSSLSLNVVWVASSIIRLLNSPLNCKLSLPCSLACFACSAVCLLRLGLTLVSRASLPARKLFGFFLPFHHHPRSHPRCVRFPLRSAPFGFSNFPHTLPFFLRGICIPASRLTLAHISPATS